MRGVTDGEPSDHDAFVCDFLGGFGLAFRAVTFNAAKHTAHQLAAALGAIEHHHPGVWLLQEVKRRRGIGRWLRRRGYGLKRVDPEFATAWDKTEWEYVRSWRPLMSPTEYWTVNYALVVVLRHRRTGLLGKFVNVHPPAHVQAPRHPSFPRVSKVLREWKLMLNRLARRNFNRRNERDGGIDFVLSGGDENFDFDRSPEAPSWLLDGPLEIVDPPKPTRGRRKIDRFRVRGLRAA